LEGNATILTQVWGSLGRSGFDKAYSEHGDTGGKILEYLVSSSSDRFLGRAPRYTNNAYSCRPSAQNFVALG
jgi:hypothetical protein